MGTRNSHFGTLRRLKSGRIQARYWGPDEVRHNAPLTFDTEGDAREYLATVQADIVRGVWTAPASAKAVPDQLTVEAYAKAWMEGRELKPRTVNHYQQLLDDHVLPTLGHYELAQVTPSIVERWRVALQTGPTARAHAYALLKSVFATAVSMDLVTANPCRVRGASSSKRVKKIRPATLEELTTLTASMPDRYKAMVLLASWCGLRFGELTELRRKDVDVTARKLHVHRAVVRIKGETIVGTPKSDAGVRDVSIPPHLIPQVEDHLKRHVEPGAGSLLFPATGGGHMAPASLYRVFYPAREKAGRPDLRWHDLRHTGATLAASTGATLAELMARLGHSTPGAAMRYQHAAQDRDTIIADALSALVMLPKDTKKTSAPKDTKKAAKAARKAG